MYMLEGVSQQVWVPSIRQYCLVQRRAGYRNDSQRDRDQALPDYCQTYIWGGVYVGKGAMPLSLST